MSKYDIKEVLKEKNQCIINVIALLIPLEKEDINPYLKKRILYLLNPEANEYCKYIPYNKRKKQNDNNKQ